MTCTDNDKGSTVLTQIVQQCKKKKPCACQLKICMDKIAHIPYLENTWPNCKPCGTISNSRKVQN